MDNDLVFIKTQKGQTAFSNNNLSADEMAVMSLVDTNNNVLQIVKAISSRSVSHTENILLRLARFSLIKTEIERRKGSCETFCQACIGLRFVSENELEQRVIMEGKYSEANARSEDWMAKCIKLQTQVDEYGSVLQGHSDNEQKSNNEIEQRVIVEGKYREANARAEDWMAKCTKLQKRVEGYGSTLQVQLGNAKLLSQQCQEQFEEEQSARIKAEADYNEAQKNLKELDAELLGLRQTEEKLSSVHLNQVEQLTSLKLEELELLKLELHNAELVGQNFKKQFEEEQVARLKAEADYIGAQKYLKELDAELLGLHQTEEKLRSVHLNQEEHLTSLKLEEVELVKRQLHHAKLEGQNFQKQFEEERAARIKAESDYSEAQKYLKELDAELLGLRQTEEKLSSVHLNQVEQLTSLKLEELELLKLELHNAELVGQNFKKQFEEERAARLKTEDDHHAVPQHWQEKISLPIVTQPDRESSTEYLASIHPYYQMIRPLGFCKNMSDAELSDLLFIAEWQDAKAGDTIYSEGEQGVLFYVVVSGKLRVVKNRKPLSALRTGDVFGEHVFLSGGEPVRFEGVIAKTDCKLMVIDPAKLGNYALTFQLHVMEAFVRREVAKLYFAEERISKLLLY